MKHLTFHRWKKPQNVEDFWVTIEKIPVAAILFLKMRPKIFVGNLSYQMLSGGYNYDIVLNVE